MSEARKFSKAQLSSFAATVVDYSTLVFSVEILKIYYVIATIAGALVGAITNFTINRYWAFESRQGALRRQASKYALVALGSLVLNTLLVFVLTSKVGILYLYSKIIASLSVGFFWNYVLHRYYVFKL